MRPRLQCPFKGCPLAGQKFPCIDSLAGHISDCHSWDFRNLHGCDFHRQTLYPCRHCG